MLLIQHGGNVKISKRQLRKLIKEAFIGQVNKPPVNVQNYLNNPDMHPKIASQLQSGIPGNIRSGLNLAGSLTGDDMAFAILDASLEDDSFLKKEKPLDKDKNKVDAVISQMEQMNLLNGKMFNDELYIEDYRDKNVYAEFEIIIDGSIINEIYGLLAQGNDAAGKKVGMNYFSDDGKFFADNPQAYEECKKIAKYYGALNFADLYYNYKKYSPSLTMAIAGLLPQDVETWPSQVTNIEMSVGQFGNKVIEAVPPSLADAKAKIFRLAKAMGLLSMPHESHPIGYYFWGRSNLLKGFTEIRVDF